MTPLHERLTITRGDLLGDEPLLGAAERARRTVAAATRRFSMVGCADGVLARVDGWRSDDELVLHGHSGPSDPPRRCLYVDRDRGGVAVMGAAVELAGDLPTGVGAPVPLGPLASIRASAMPAGLEWLLLLIEGPSTAPCRMAVIGASRMPGVSGRSGPVAATFDDLGALRRPVELAPVARRSASRTLSEFTLGGRPSVV